MVSSNESEVVKVLDEFSCWSFCSGWRFQWNRDPVSFAVFCSGYSWAVSIETGLEHRPAVMMEQVLVIVELSWVRFSPFHWLLLRFGSYLNMGPKGTWCPRSLWSRVCNWVCIYSIWGCWLTVRCAAVWGSTWPLRGRGSPALQLCPAGCCTRTWTAGCRLLCVMGSASSAAGPAAPPAKSSKVVWVSECWLGEHCGTQTRLSHCGCYFCFRTMSELQERTFIAIKPDGVQRGIIGEIIKRFEMKGFKLVGMKMVQVRRVFPLSNQPAEDLQSLFKPHVRLNGSRWKWTDWLSDLFLA